MLDTVVWQDRESCGVLTTSTELTHYYCSLGHSVSELPWCCVRSQRRSWQFAETLGPASGVRVVQHEIHPLTSAVAKSSIGCSWLLV